MLHPDDAFVQPEHCLVVVLCIIGIIGRSPRPRHCYVRGWPCSGGRQNGTVPYSPLIADRLICTFVCESSIPLWSRRTWAKVFIAARERLLALSCHLRMCWRKDIGTWCPRDVLVESCAPTSTSRTSIKIHSEHILSVKRTSRGLGSRPALSPRMRSSLATRASSVSGSLAATVLISCHRLRLARSEAREITSRAESRTAFRSFHIILCGKVDGGSAKRGSIEMYGQDRFFTVSGRGL